jgi:hypothetical protein
VVGYQNPGDCRASDGACTNCLGSPEGDFCMTTNNVMHCGCQFASDCPMGYACDTTSSTCTNRCGLAGITTVCNGGCCGPNPSGSGLVCVVGTDAHACGETGGLCSDCAQSTLGLACVSAICGCTQPSDCPPATPTCMSNHVCH